MERRNFIKAAMLGGAAVVLAGGHTLADMYYPVKVDEALWQGINRAKNPTELSGLEKLHVPVINAPEQANSGKIFPVEVSVGQAQHPMGPSHWIEHLQLNIGNEPVGNVIFHSHGYVKAVAKFDVLPGDELKGRTISLVVQIKCNLHGIWQSYTNVKVV
jgi:superoxide reductase